MKKEMKNRMAAAAVMLLSLVVAAGTLTACSSPQGGAGGIGLKKAEIYEMAVAETAASSEAPAMNYMYDEMAVAEEAAYGLDEGAYMAGGETTTVQNPNRKLIKNVYLDIETKEFDGLTNALGRQVSEMGGYIECSNISYPSSFDDYLGRRSMNFSARIPAERLDEFVQHVENSGNVTYKSENVTDVTLQYTDIESKKKSLQLEQEKLNELMQKAETVEDTIAIEARQSEVRYQLESIESQLRTYDNQVEYSTVNVNVNEVVDYTPVKEYTVWERISEGFNASIRAIGEFFKNLFVGIIAYSPIILLAGAIIAVIVLIIRKLVKKNKKQKEDIKEDIKEEPDNTEESDKTEKPEKTE